MPKKGKQNQQAHVKSVNKHNARARVPSLKIKQREMPQARSFEVTLGQARIKQDKGKVVIEHSELFYPDMPIQADGSLTTFPINPGLSPGPYDANGTFSFASNRAEGYNKYRFRSLSFSYVPSKATLATPGLVGLGFVADPNEGPLATLSSFSNIATRNVGSVSASVKLDIPAKYLGGERYIRLGNVADKRITDVGALYAFSVDGESTSIAGNVWVTYILELIEAAPAATYRRNDLELDLAADTAVAAAGSMHVPFSQQTYASALMHHNDDGSVWLPPGSYTFDWIVTFETNTSTGKAFRMYTSLVAKDVAVPYGGGSSTQANSINDTLLGATISSVGHVNYVVPPGPWVEFAIVASIYCGGTGFVGGTTNVLKTGYSNLRITPH